MALQGVKIQEFSGHTQAIYALCTDGQSGSFYSAGGDGMIVRWFPGVADGVLCARQEGAVYALFSKDGYLYSGTNKGVLSVFSPEGTLIGHLQISAHPVFEIVYLYRHFLLLCGDGCLYALDDDLNLQAKLKISEQSLRSVCKTPEGLAIGSSDGKITLLDRQLNCLSARIAHKGTVFSLACDESASVLISGGKDALLKFHKEQDTIAEIPAHLLHIHGLAFNPLNGLLLSCSMDKTIKIWDAAEQKLLKVLDYERSGGHRSSVNKILWFDKNNFISCSDDRTLMCFEIQAKQ